MTPDEKEQLVAAHGLDPEHAERWYMKWYKHRDSANNARKLTTQLSFGDYLDKVQQAELNHPDQIGRTSDTYVLARFTDEGPYTIDSCRFVTGLVNRQESWTNGRNDAWVLRMSALLKGQTKETSPRVARMAATKTGWTKATHPGLARQADRIARDYELQDPEENVYLGRNVREFCKVHGLNHGNICGVLNGRLQHAKGWTHFDEPDLTGHFPDDDDRNPDLFGHI